MFRKILNLEVPLNIPKTFFAAENQPIARSTLLNLKLQEPFHSINIQITMRCMKTRVAMAFEDTINQIYGFQFHPESFLTKNGKYLIQKIISA